MDESTKAIVSILGVVAIFLLLVGRYGFDFVDVFLAFWAFTLVIQGYKWVRGL